MTIYLCRPVDPFAARVRCEHFLVFGSGLRTGVFRSSELDTTMPTKYTKGDLAAHNPPR